MRGFLENVLSRNQQNKRRITAKYSNVRHVKPLLQGRLFGLDFKPVWKVSERTLKDFLEKSPHSFRTA